MLLKFAASLRPELRSSDRDDGFSLLEVVITTSILMIVMTAILSTLELAMRQERRTTAVVDNQNSVMIAMNRVTRELRGANPIDVDNVVDSSEMETAVTLWVGTEASGDLKQWRFRVAPNATTGQPELLAECLTNCPLPTSPPSTEVLVPRLANTVAEPVFQYYEGFNDGEILTTTAGASDQVAPDIVARCAVRMTVRIRSDGAGDAPVYDTSTDAEIRNSIPGGTGGWPGAESGKQCSAATDEI